ncbi:MAG: helix-turn-helix domain-containing protein [Dysgonomonas sp.]
MKKKNFVRVGLDSISEQMKDKRIKNFIISDATFSEQPDLSTRYPFIFEGVAFLICTQGAGKMKINFKEYEFGENSFIAILPYYLIDFISIDADTKINFLIFSLDFVREITENANQSYFKISPEIIQSPCLSVSVDEIKVLLNFHSFIEQQQSRNDHPFREYIVRNLLCSFFAEIGSIYMSQSTAGIEVKMHNDMETRFFKLLTQYYKEHRTVSFYADKMCLTPKYLSTAIKQLTGKTVFSWINEAIISSTKYMLRATDMTVAEISEELNFPNPSFLGRLFRQKTGMTPLQYRHSK